LVKIIGSVAGPVAAVSVAAIPAPAVEPGICATVGASLKVLHAMVTRMAAEIQTHGRKIFL
jgi:hypothetical protein